ncbi:LPXTG-motif cell wall anchor domain protein [Parvimonas sp. oral taxon 393 str. F0440]|nr:LPXTG-motif cell wall anchor domain protein [Parvimonas sp. oral taxon 393 str. F0440]
MKKALNQIDNIAQDNFIDTVKRKVKEDIDKAGIIENKAKDVAKNSIDKAIQKQIEKINSEKDSTKEEKYESINKLNARVMKAKMTIDNATTAKAVENAKNDGIKNIELIKAETKIKKLLKKAVEDKDETIKMDAFKNANKEKQDAYLKAIEEGQKILDEPMATKKDVEDANKSIEIAKKSLDGKAMGQDKGKDKDKDKAKDKDNGKIKDKSKDNGNSKDKAKDNGSTKDKDKAKEQNRTNDSNKSKGSKVSNTQKKSKSKLPKTSYSNGIVAYGISILASAFGAFSIRKKKKED